MGRVLSKDGNILVSTVVHILANIIDTATSLHASILKVTIVFIGKIYYCSVIRPKHNAVSYSAINNTVIPVSFGIPSSRQIDNNTYVFAIERLQNVLIYLNLSFNKVSLGFNIPGKRVLPHLPSNFTRFWYTYTFKRQEICSPCCICLGNRTVLIGHFYTKILNCIICITPHSIRASILRPASRIYCLSSCTCI